MFVVVKKGSASLCIVYPLLLGLFNARRLLHCLTDSVGEFAMIFVMILARNVPMHNFWIMYLHIIYMDIYIHIYIYKVMIDSIIFCNTMYAHVYYVCKTICTHCIRIYIHTRTIYIVLWVMVPKMALHSTLSPGAAPQPSRRSDVWRLFVGHLCCWPLGSWQTSCRRGMSRVASRHQVQLRHPEGTESGDPWKKTPFLDTEKQVNFDRRWYVSLVEDW